MSLSRKRLEEAETQEDRENVDRLITLFILLAGVAVALVMLLTAHSS
jgi:hypothetical protein